MINEQGQRALAHIEQIISIDPIEGADRIEVATVLGWKVVIAKADNFQVGDKVIYVEVDSRVPDTDTRFAFLKDRKYRVKTIRLKGQYSQGLILKIDDFPEVKDKNIGDDVTKDLKITYYIAEDNTRKAEYDKEAVYKSMSQRHPNVAKTKWYRWLYKRDWGKKILFFFFGKKRKDVRAFPTKFPYIHKTDEERVENMPWILECKEPWVKTTKLDGTSSTYIVERLPFKRYEYYVTSRNVRQLDRDQATFHSNEENVYWDMSDKYDIYNKLKNYLDKKKLDYVCIQGEIVGPGIQGNPHKLKEVGLYVFNFIDSDKGRYNSIEAQRICIGMGFNFVPIIDNMYTLPDDLEEFKLSADGPCELPGASGPREGYVYRSQDGTKSFKNVSRLYAMSRN